VVSTVGAAGELDGEECVVRRGHLPVDACVYKYRDSPSAGGSAREDVQREPVSGCAQYPLCRWDGYATYNYKSSASQISALDYFHPSLSGQAALAQVTWSKSWWGA